MLGVPGVTGRGVPVLEANVSEVLISTRAGDGRG